MNFGHTADIHFGDYPGLGEDNDDGINQRSIDIVNTSIEIINKCKINNVSHLLVAGDLFKRPTPSNKDIRDFAKFVQYAQEHKVQLFICKGNHDSPFSRGKEHALAAFKTLNLDGVHIMDNLGIYKFSQNDKNEQSFWILNIPYLSLSGFEGKNTDEKKSSCLKLIETAIDMFNKEVEEFDGIKISMGHLHADCVSIDELDGLEYVDKFFVPLSTLQRIDAEYVAL